MKTNQSIRALLAGLLLAASPVFAEESRHPLGFEPVPVFDDEVPARKPFQAMPPPVAKTAPEAARIPKAVAEPAKPEPAAAPPSSAPPKATAAPVPAEPVPVVQSAPVTPAEPQGSQGNQPVPNRETLSALLMENYPAGLIVLALGGFVFWNVRRSESASRVPCSAVAGNPQGATGQTGVARYLGKLEASAKPAKPATGVSRYLERRG